MQDNNNMDNKSKSGMQEECQPHSVGSMVALFNRLNAHHEAGQGRLPATVHDRAEFGSQTALRYLVAQAQIIEETTIICNAIQKHGTPEERKPDQRVIRFGLLFTIAADLTDKLECLLRFARKINLIDYEGEVLLQNVHNNIPITLKAPIACIKADLHQRLDVIKIAIKAEGDKNFENPYQTLQDLGNSESKDKIPVKCFSSNQLAAQLLNVMGEDLVYQTMLQMQQKLKTTDQLTDDDVIKDLTKKRSHPLVVIFESSERDSIPFLEFDDSCGTSHSLDDIEQILPQPTQASTDVSVEEMFGSEGDTIHSANLILQNSSIETQLIEAATIEKPDTEDNKFVAVEKLLGVGNDVAFPMEISGSVLTENHREEQQQEGGNSFFEASLRPRQESGFDGYQQTDNEAFPPVPAEGPWMTFEKPATELGVPAPLIVLEEAIQMPPVGIVAPDNGSTKKNKKKNSIRKTIFNWFTKPCMGSNEDE